MKLKDWTAKRAGGRITVTGIDIETDQPQKIVGVDKISVSDGVIVAIDKNASFHILSL